jgi:hypothetical protein
MHIPAKYEFSGPKNSKNRPSKIREKSKKIEKSPKLLKKSRFFINNSAKKW